MANFNGKKVLVIGGSRGIGAAIVRRFAGDGATVAFTYAGATEAAKALASETGAAAIRSDAADRDAVINVVKDQGALDVLVVNAGTLVLGDPLEVDADAVDRMIDVNVRAPYHAAVEAARQMPEGGRIIIVGSVNGDRMPFAGGAAYALTKSAVQGMARGLARDFGARGITVNVIQPGPTSTDMNPEDGPMSDFMHSFMAIAPRPPGGSRRPCGLSRRPRSRFHDGSAPYHRRRLWRLTRRHDPTPCGGGSRHGVVAFRQYIRTRAKRARNAATPLRKLHILTNPALHDRS